MDEKRTTVEKQHEKSHKSHERVCENLSFAAKEAFKRLRTNVVMSFDESEEKCRVIGVTSAQPSEGKSTVSLNLAYSLSELGKRVLLVDADLRRPSISAKLRIRQTPGLSNLLGDVNSITSTIQRYTSSTSDASFDIITSGDIPKNPSELLNSQRMEKLMAIVSKAYDYLIIDLPPVGTVIDAVMLTKHTDGMIVVIRENDCPRGVLRDCVEQLKFANVNILGFVVNGAIEGAGKKYKYSGYYY